jgi:dTDP-4-dehydrorhamnose 3,5-epimerase
VLEPLAVPGAFLLAPRVFADDRGDVLEWYGAADVAAAAGRAVPFVRGTRLRSRRGVVRGIHFTAVPPGQAKYVTCLSGAVVDVVVDLRVGSPAFGRWVAVELTAGTGRAVHLGEGLGHGLQALTDDATVVLLASGPFDPSVERGVHPLDPQLAVAWPLADPVLSARDAAAPTLSEARAAGLLPPWQPPG